MRITHPFHPLSGQAFILVAERSSRHGDRIWYEQPDGSVGSVPRSWTDHGEGDPFVTLAAGEAHFRAEDLMELLELMAGLTDVGDGVDNA